MRQFRQGDVLLVATISIPCTLAPQERENGRIILAHGEATGHSHAIADQGAILFGADIAERYLKVSRPVRLYHEEHDEIRLPAGTYRVVIQREYSPEEIRRVVD